MTTKTNEAIATHGLSTRTIAKLKKTDPKTASLLKRASKTCKPSVNWRVAAAKKAWITIRKNRAEAAAKSKSRKRAA